jgi:apolipoprotein N-acyltransferase
VPPPRFEGIRGVLLAVLSGVLLALSFPKFGSPAFGWIALTPLLVVLGGAISLRRAFVLGLTTGLVYFAGTLYWLTGVMTVYGDLPAWVAVPLNAAFVAYLAFFPAIFTTVTRRLVMAYGAQALMATPIVWVATELGRTYIMTGFPWVLLGYSQVTVLPVAQVASLFGVYGVSALVAGVSAAAAMLALRPAQARLRFASAGLAGAQSAEAAGPYVVTMLVLLAGLSLWGGLRVARSEWTKVGDPVRVGLIQGNIDQAQKYDSAHAASIFQDYVRLTRQAIGDGATFVLWPEASTPFRFEEDRADADQIRAIARQARVPILLGSDQVERGPATRYYNAAFLVGDDGTTVGVYRKMHLVPWGEYVPLKQVLFFVAPLIEAVSDFSAGDRAVMLPVRGHLISTAICYEIVYPDLIRQFVVGGSELLTTITNDAWFGTTSAPYQHFEQASMRAIETGRYLVRSANTGISGIVDPYGRVLARSDIYQSAVVVGDARFLRTSTLYSQIGDAFAYACVALTGALLVLGWRHAR